MRMPPGAGVPPGTVLVTGATGFAGRALVQSLVQQGVAVRATGRDAIGFAAICAAGVEFVAADIEDAGACERLTAGVGAVVHLAARVHVLRDREREPLAAYRRTNVEATRALAEAAARQGARQFVFASSVKVNGEATPGRPYSETDPPRPADPYGVSKLEAECVLAGIAARSGLALTVLRPPLMYGPGVKGNMARLARAVRAGLPLPLAGIENRRSLLSVGNFCSAVLRALERPGAGARIYLLADGEDLSTPELVRRMARACSVRARLFACPPALLRLAGAPFGLGPELARLCGSLVVDSSKLRRELDWTPPESVDEGLRRAFAA